MLAFNSISRSLQRVCVRTIASGSVPRANFSADAAGSGDKGGNAPNKAEGGDKKPQQEQKVADLSKGEHLFTRDRNERDLEYQEYAAKFQREWKKYANDKEQSQQKVLEEKLTEHQKQRVQFVVEAIEQLSPYEVRYMLIKIRQNMQAVTNMDLMKLNIDWPSVKQLDDGTWPPNNPNWFLQQEAMARLWPAGQQNMASLLGMFGMGGGGGGGGAAGAASGAPAAGGAQAQQGAAGDKKDAAAAAAGGDKKEAKKDEKQNFDIELTKIDEAQKIKIIKEVRGILNLGLKEAKDLVDKTPAILKKALKKAEADELKEKLEKIGCTITLV